jgi:hypothetical protein
MPLRIADVFGGEGRGWHHAPSLDAVLEDVVPRTIDSMQQRGVERVAIYGAGTHTERLLPVWRALGGPAVVAVLTTVAGGRQELADIPIVSSDEFDPASVQAVLLSSQTYEQELAAIAEERWPDLPAIRLYWHPTCSVASHHRESCADRSKFADQRRAV